VRTYQQSFPERRPYSVDSYFINICVYLSVGEYWSGHDQTQVLVVQEQVC